MKLSNENIFTTSLVCIYTLAEGNCASIQATEGLTFLHERVLCVHTRNCSYDTLTREYTSVFALTTAYTTLNNV